MSDNQLIEDLVESQYKAYKELSDTDMDLKLWRMLSLEERTELFEREKNLKTYAAIDILGNIAIIVAVSEEEVLEDCRAYRCRLATKEEVAWNRGMKAIMPDNAEKYLVKPNG